MDLIMVHCNCPNEELARQLGRELVKRQLAACVSITPLAGSIYRWEGEIVEDMEFMLQIKSRLAVYEALEQCLLELHPYDVPEILALPVVAGLNSYLDWVVQSCPEPDSTPGS